MTLVEPRWDDARAAAHAAGHGLATEEVPLAEGDRRTLAADLAARIPLPPRETSAMDGWAVSGDGPWRVVGQVLAGTLRVEPLEPGQAVTIATGAVPPPSTRGVLRREHGRLDPDETLHGEVIAGQDLRPAGEEAAVGEVLVDAGTVLNPAHLGVAAAAGFDALEVIRRPVARVLVFGDELLDTGASRDGRVRDSLGPQLPAWLDRLGVRTLEVVRVEDTLEAHVDALSASAEVDLVVTTGGTAAGPVDHLHAAFAASGGSLIVDSVAVRPGHPMLMGQWNDLRWLLGLPGNPQSAVIALLTLGAPLVAALQGRPIPALSDVTLTAAIGGPKHETRLALARLDGTDVTAVAHLGSAMLRGLADADGLAVIPPGGAAAGDVVRWLALPRS